MTGKISSDLRDWVGREAVYTAPEELSAASIRYFAMALDDRNPLYTDDAFASRTRHGGMIAPPTMVCETNQIVGQNADRDGYIGHHWDIPVNNGRFMRGSNEYEFFRPVRPSDRITVKWKILRIYERNTVRLGRLIFVYSEATYFNQNGDIIAINRETNIYRP